MAIQDIMTSFTRSDPIYQEIADFLGVSIGVLIFLLTIISIWALIWKGLALWKSAHKKQTIWFIVLLIVNTVGILEILYLYVFSKIGERREKPKFVKRK